MDLETVALAKVSSLKSDGYAMICWKKRSSGRDNSIIAAPTDANVLKRRSAKSLAL